MYILCPRVRTTRLPCWDRREQTTRPLLPKRPQLCKWLGGRGTSGAQGDAQSPRAVRACGSLTGRSGRAPALRG